MAVTPRTIKRGSGPEFVTAIVTDITGADISAATFEVAHILDADKTDDPDTYTWETPHAESSSPTLSTRLVKKLVTGVLINDQKTKYRVFVRVTDSPEILLVDCGTYSVVP